MDQPTQALHPPPTLPRQDRLRTAETSLADFAQIFTLAGVGHPLNEALNALCRLIERWMPGALCSILLLEDGRRLRHGGNVSLPLEYIQSIDGTEIGLETGSCGAAAFQKRRIVVSDIETHPYWAAYRHLALRFGLAACWSTPLLQDDGSVPGTFAVYCREKREPIAAELALIDQVAAATRLLLELHRTETELRQSQRMLQALLDNIPICIFWKDRESRYLGANRRFLDNIRLKHMEELLGKTDFDLPGDPVNAPRYRADDQEVIRSGQAKLDFEEPGQSADGANFWFQTSKAPLIDENGCITGVLGVYTDITRQKQTEAALRDSELKLRLLFEEMREGVALVRQGRITFANPYMAYLLDLDDAYQLIGHDLLDFMTPESRMAAQQDLTQRLAHPADARSLLELAFKRSDGGLRWLEVSSRTVELSGQIHELGIYRDVTERKRSEDQIRRLAYHDPLTGLPNRMLLLDRLGRALATAARANLKVVLLFLDLDFFKQVNDTLGHTVGDICLRSLAQRLLGAIRQEDTLARLGGDEFLILLPNAHSGQDATRVAEHILHMLTRPMSVMGHEVHLSISIGISVFPDDGHDGETLIHAADMAMYQAKKMGRSRYRFHGR